MGWRWFHLSFVVFVEIFVVVFVVGGGGGRVVIVLVVGTAEVVEGVHLQRVFEADAPLPLLL